MLKQLAQWRQSKTGYAVFGGFEMLGAAAFAWLAVTGGNWIDWICTFLLLFLAVQDIGRYRQKATDGR